MPGRRTSPRAAPEAEPGAAALAGCRVLVVLNVRQAGDGVAICSVAFQTAPLPVGLRRLANRQLCYRRKRLP